MAENTRWNKKIFALLLNEAKGVRSWRQFAADSGISYVQMRKLAMCEQENPPRPKLIRKVAAQAFGDIDLADFMFAAGVKAPDLKPRRAPETGAASAVEKYRALSPRDRRAADRFIDFLYAGSETAKNQNG
ncbi:MAG: hypothetical protein J5925_00165 [Clostridia bacterium]|nr:hypothetical protein [Clostridia bacterium]MBR5746168.1 hypothetical protein [Clostridia bacterium]